MRAEMKQILADIQSGAFASEWVEENRNGLPNYHRLQNEGAEHPVEKVGAKLRAMMPFLSSGGQSLKTFQEDNRTGGGAVRL